MVPGRAADFGQQAGQPAVNRITHRTELFPDSFIADLFPSATGRPSLPADLVGSVLVLKELYDLSGTQTADALKYDLR